jgi:hypothetical protein
MNKLSILLILGLAFSNLLGAELSEESKCEQHIEETIKKLNLLYESDEVAPIAFDRAQLQSERRNDQYRQLSVWRFYIAQGVIVDCLPGSGDVYSVLRSNVVDAAPLYDSKPVPAWTMNQAAEKAKPWVQAVLGYYPANLSAPRGSFDSDMRDAKRYYDGEWTIRWHRTDSEGHVFELDDLVVNLSEKYGMTGCRLNFDSTFEEGHGPLISSKEALAAARSPAEILLNNRGLVGPFIPSGLQLGDAKTDLWIVNPSNVFQSKTADQVVNKLAARLAWTVEYTLMNGKTPDPDHTMTIKIDARTKEVLGADFH